MGKTKEKILDTARELFNKLGYSQVTIRQIASALGMSSGNLNYHFKTREEILETLYFQMVEQFDQRVEALDQHSFTLKAVHHDMKTSMARMVDYRFFWTDLYNLLSLSKIIRKHFEEARMTRVKGYQFLFSKLIEKELLHSPTFAQEYDFLIDRMIDYGNTWLYASTLYKGKRVTKSKIDHYAVKLLSILFPYLTKAGKAEYRDQFLTDIYYS